MTADEQNAIIIGWVIVASVGFVFTLIGLRYAISDRDWLEQERLNGQRAILVNHDVRQEWLRLLLLFGFLLVGVSRLLLPMPGGSIRVHLSPAEWFYEVTANVVFLGAPVVLTIMSILSYRDRHRMLTKLPGHDRRSGRMGNPERKENR